MNRLTKALATLGFAGATGVVGHFAGFNMGYEKGLADNRFKNSITNVVSLDYKYSKNEYALVFCGDGSYEICPMHQENTLLNGFNAQNMREMRYSVDSPLGQDMPGLIMHTAMLGAKAYEKREKLKGK